MRYVKGTVAGVDYRSPLQVAVTASQTPLPVSISYAWRWKKGMATKAFVRRNGQENSFGDVSPVMVLMDFAPWPAAALKDNNREVHLIKYEKVYHIGFYCHVGRFGSFVMQQSQ